ncbi:unnamed protein product, partial [Mesorhabditis spiculigera]
MGHSQRSRGPGYFGNELLQRQIAGVTRRRSVEMGRMKNKICEICHLTASGSYFSVVSCRACAAFFRRTAFLNIVYVCQKDRFCDVTKKKRFSCRSCRYQKCWDKGMRPSMIKGLENSKNSWPASTTTSETGSSPSGCSQTSESTSLNGLDEHIKTEQSIDGHPATPAEIRDFMDRRQKAGNKMQEVLGSKKAISNLLVPIKLTLVQRGLLALNEHFKKWPMCTPEKVRPGQPFTLEEWVDDLQQELVNITEFCMAFEEFAGLDKEQKGAIFLPFWTHFLVLERYRTTNYCLPNTTTSILLLYNGNYYDLEERHIWTRKSKSMKMIFDFAKPQIDKETQLMDDQLDRTALTDFELVFVMLQIMWTLKENPELTQATKDLAGNVRQRLSSEIHDYYTNEMNRPNYAGRLMQVMKIVAAFSEVEKGREEGAAAFKAFSFVPDRFQAPCSPRR